MNHEFPGSPETPSGWEVMRHLWDEAVRRVRVVLRRLRGFPAEPDPEAERFSVPEQVLPYEPSDADIFFIPAKGDAFDFHIEVRLEWCARGRAVDSTRREPVGIEPRHLVHACREDVRVQVIDAVRLKARKVEPDQPAELENALRSDGICVNLNGGALRCHAHIHVSACDEIRERLRPQELKRIEQREETERHLEYVKQLTRLSHAWEEVLRHTLTQAGEIDAAKTGWLAPAALALAEHPENAYAHLLEALKKRQKNSEQLVDRLRDLTRQADRLDVLDFLVDSDSALRAVLKDLGVPPSTDHDVPSLVGDEER